MSNADWLREINLFLIKNFDSRLEVSRSDKDTYVIFHKSNSFLDTYKQSVGYIWSVSAHEPLDNREVRERLYKGVNKFLFSK